MQENLEIEKKNNEIEYILLNVNAKSKEKTQFFHWALNHRLFQTQSNSNYQSRMKNIYTEKKESKDISAVIAVHMGKPIALLLSENINKKEDLIIYKENRLGNIKEIKKINGEAIMMGFLSFYVTDRYRRKGIAGKMMELMEIEKMKTFFTLKNEDKYGLMIFEGREKALTIIKKKSHFSHQIDMDDRSFNYKLRLSDYAQHVEAILQDDTHSLYYSHEKLIMKKEEPSLEMIENNKLNIVSIDKLLKITPLMETKEVIKKEVKKIPTLQPKKRVNVL